MMKLVSFFEKLISTIIALPLSYLDIWKLKEICAVKNRKLKRIYVIAFERKLRKLGSWIGWQSEFLDIPCFPHGIMGIFISAESKIGRNAVIFQDVTIGSNSLLDSTQKGSPKIGDNCYIGTGAKIIGNIIIGNNCRIGANAVVVKNIPDNSIVVIGDIRIIYKDDMDNRFYSKDINGDNVYFDNGIYIKTNNQD